MPYSQREFLWPPLPLIRAGNVFILTVFLSPVFAPTPKFPLGLISKPSFSSKDERFKHNQRTVYIIFQEHFRHHKEYFNRHYFFPYHTCPHKPFMSSVEESMPPHMKKKQPRNETLDSRLLKTTPPLIPKPGGPPPDHSPTPSKG